MLFSAGTLHEARALDDTAPKISGQWFFAYRNGGKGNKPENMFAVKRGYINVRKRLTERLSGRITPDISIDREGDGEGDLEMRLKFCYADFALGDRGILAKPHVELGLVHRPWLDFEQSINTYRVQGKMFLERNGLFNSADFGVTFSALLGGEVDEDYRNRVNGRYPGKYGSIALGVYNGGGYHAIERNNNKTVEARLTLRPSPRAVPGFQISYHGVYGKGNTAESPDWTMNVLFASFENPRCALTATYYSGRGDFSGSAVDEKGEALEQSGFSVFGEVRMSGTGFSVMGRYDVFDDGTDADESTLSRAVAGIAYRIQGGTKVLLDYDIATRGAWADCTEAFLQISLEYDF